MGCDSAEACLREIEAAHAQTRTMTARFVQTKHLSLLKEPLVSSGRFAFKAPDRVLWAIEQPRPATIVVRGSEVVIPGLSPEDRRALAMTPLAAAAQQMGAMFAGSVAALARDFVVDAHGHAGGITVGLVPRAAAWKEAFQSMELRFVRPDLGVREIRMEDRLGDRLEIVLRDVQRNVDLPESTFAVPGE